MFNESYLVCVCKLLWIDIVLLLCFLKQLAFFIQNLESDQVRLDLLRWRALDFAVQNFNDVPSRLDFLFRNDAEVFKSALNLHLFVKKALDSGQACCKFAKNSRMSSFFAIPKYLFCCSSEKSPYSTQSMLN